MVVALRALNPHAHEDLSDVLRRLQRVLLVLEVVCRRAGKRSAPGRQQFLSQFIDRRVLLDPFLKPAVIEEHRLVIDAIGHRADHQQFRPLHHPHVDKLLPLQELIDQVGSLVGIFAGEKRAILITGREHATDIDAHSTDKLFIRAELRWIDPEFAKLLVHQFVNDIRGGRVCPGELEARRQRDGVDANGVRIETGHDEGLAPVLCGHQPVHVDRCRVVVIAEEERLRGDVAVGAVGIDRPCRHLLRGIHAVEHDLRRIDLNAFNGWHFGWRGVVFCAFDKPAPNRGVILFALLDLLATAVRHGVGALGENQAVIRQGEIDPPSADLTGDPLVVGSGVESKERQAEAVLAPCRTVAGSGVAAVSHKNRHDVEPETEMRILGRPLHMHRHAEGLATGGDLQRGVAIGKRIERGVLNSRERWIRQSKCRFPGEIAGDAAGLHELDHHRLTVLCRRKMHIRRIGMHRRCRILGRRRRNKAECQQSNDRHDGGEQPSRMLTSLGLAFHGCISHGVT